MSSSSLVHNGLSSVKRRRKDVSHHSKNAAIQYSIRKAEMEALGSPASIGRRQRRKPHVSSVCSSPIKSAFGRTISATDGLASPAKSVRESQVSLSRHKEVIGQDRALPDLEAFLAKQALAKNQRDASNHRSDVDRPLQSPPKLGDLLVESQTEASWGDELQEMWIAHSSVLIRDSVRSETDTASSTPSDMRRTVFDCESDGNLFRLHSPADNYDGSSLDSTSIQFPARSKQSHRLESPRAEDILSNFQRRAEQDLTLLFRPTMMNIKEIVAAAPDQTDRRAEKEYCLIPAQVEAPLINLSTTGDKNLGNPGEYHTRFEYEFRPLGYSCDQYSHHRRAEDYDNSFRFSLSDHLKSFVESSESDDVLCERSLKQDENVNAKAKGSCQFADACASPSSVSINMTTHHKPSFVCGLRASTRNTFPKMESLGESKRHELEAFKLEMSLSREMQSSREKLPKSIRIARERYWASKIPPSAKTPFETESRASHDLQFVMKLSPSTYVLERPRLSKAYLKRKHAPKVQDFGKAPGKCTFELLQPFVDDPTFSAKELELLSRSGIVLPDLDAATAAQNDQQDLIRGPDDVPWERNLLDNISRWGSKKRNAKKLCKLLETSDQRKKEDQMSDAINLRKEAIAVVSPFRSSALTEPCRSEGSSNGPGLSNALSMKLTPLTPIVGKPEISPFVSVRQRSAESSAVNSIKRRSPNIYNDFRTPPDCRTQDKSRDVTPLALHLEDFSAGLTKAFRASSDSRSIRRKRTTRKATPLGLNSQQGNDSNTFWPKTLNHVRK